MLKIPEPEETEGADPYVPEGSIIELMRRRVPPFCGPTYSRTHNPFAPVDSVAAGPSRVSYGAPVPQLRSPQLPGRNRSPSVASSPDQPTTRE